MRKGEGGQNRRGRRAERSRGGKKRETGSYDALFAEDKMAFFFYYVFELSEFLCSREKNSESMNNFGVYTLVNAVS